MNPFKTIKSLVRSLGWQLVKVPNREVTVVVPSSELREINKILHDFSQNTLIAELRSYSDLRSYLNEERIALFHEIVDLLIRHGIRMDDQTIGDVGCGMGYLFRRINQVAEPAQMTGYDTYSEILDLAGKICPGARFEERSIFEVNSVHDITFCMEVLEHMVDPGEALQELNRQTRPDGTLVLSVPDGRYDFQAAGKIRDDGKSYWGHIHFWSPESWALFLKSHIPSDHSIHTGHLGKRHLYAIIQKRSTQH